MKKNKMWLKGFLQGVTGSILVMGGVFYLQYGALPLIGDSVVTGNSAHKAARIEKLVEENYLEETDSDTLSEGMYAGMMASLQDPSSGFLFRIFFRRKL